MTTTRRSAKLPRARAFVKYALNIVRQPISNAIPTTMNVAVAPRERVAPTLSENTTASSSEKTINQIAAVSLMRPWSEIRLSGL